MAANTFQCNNLKLTRSRHLSKPKKLFAWRVTQVHNYVSLSKNVFRILKRKGSLIYASARSASVGRDALASKEWSCFDTMPSHFLHHDRKKPIDWLRRREAQI